MNHQNHQSQKTKVVILGAGCSVKYGYPLAQQTREHLQQFADSIRDSAPKVCNLVRQTVDLFDRLKERRCPVDTLDELAHSIHEGKLTESSPFPPDQAKLRIEADRLVREAKLAVAALFLYKEVSAAQQGLAGYRKLMTRLFGHTGAIDQSALEQTPYRVLTFNYDRLFELAYRQNYRDDQSLDLYGKGILNTGLSRLPGQQPIEVDLNRFSLLKLHGSVDLYHFEGDAFSNYVYHAPDPARPQSVRDDDFFYPSGDGPNADRPKPALIVFPHEKGFLEKYPNNRLSFRSYIPKIWEAARYFAAQADEIRIIGYSCPEPDFLALRSLLEVAKECTSIVIQDPAADIICRRLRRDLPDQAHSIEPCELTFEDG